jgi:hypothetical protein
MVPSALTHAFPLPVEAGLVRYIGMLHLTTVLFFQVPIKVNVRAVRGSMKTMTQPWNGTDRLLVFPPAVTTSIPWLPAMFSAVAWRTCSRVKTVRIAGHALRFQAPAHRPFVGCGAVAPSAVAASDAMITATASPPPVTLRTT